MATGFDDPGFVFAQVMIEIIEGMIQDFLGAVAQRFELG